MDTLKEVIKNMVDINIIYNKGNDEMDKESFKMFRTDENHGDLSTQTQIQNGDEDLDDCFESYINGKFIETLKCLIKSEVNSAFSEHEENGNNVNECNKMEMVHNCNNEALVNSLNEHISFLQNELQSKDNIIKMLINDHGTNNSNNYVNKNTNTKDKRLNCLNSIKGVNNVETSNNTSNILKIIKNGNDERMNNYKASDQKVIILKLLDMKRMERMV